MTSWSNLVNCYNTKEAVARRLQVYRETTLPMLKSLDEEGRLRVVDGDKDDQKVKTSPTSLHSPETPETWLMTFVNVCKKILIALVQCNVLKQLIWSAKWFWSIIILYKWFIWKYFQGNIRRLHSAYWLLSSVCFLRKENIVNYYK